MLTHCGDVSFLKISREKNAFSRKFQNFLNYRLACFAKNGEKFFFKFRTF
ncbi:hypothetical protein T4D_5546 [Trichinella pseudospiralis]|uniref:Uncharacterized protein n=1 Tax=Trichinella pseudospiralis TaxID=6337 RepID=A0A0V1DQ43_TRIPS|nr:hypothetical protein T4D_5546 [Trichinella pseudospiralis]